MANQSLKQTGRANAAIEHVQLFNVWAYYELIASGQKKAEIELRDGEEISRKEWDEDGNLHNQSLHSTMARSADPGE
jgi:hypothetical protein